MKIQDLIVETKKVKWQVLKDLQPNNLKVPFHGEKTKKSIIEMGFAQAIYVWEDPEDNGIKIIDGHLRADILRELVNEGHDVPDELPCTFLDNKKIKTKEEAIKYLLRVFNVKRNPIDSEVLTSWLEEIDLSIEDVAFDDLDLKIEIEVESEGGVNINEDLRENPIYDESLYTEREGIFFNTTCKFGIPPLREDMLLECNIYDICAKASQKTEQDKNYLVLYNQFAINEKYNNAILGFFLHDKIFEAVYNQPITTLNRVANSGIIGMLTPNFSLWVDTPIAMQIWAWYKTQWCGRFFQENGIKVMPTLNWSDENSYDFCFSGVPKNVKQVIVQCRNLSNDIARKRFIKGCYEARRRLNFEKMYIYGGNIPSTKEFLEKNMPKEIQYINVNSQTEKIAELLKHLPKNAK